MAQLKVGILISGRGSNMAALEKGVMDNIFVDFRRKGSHYECTTVSSIREISKQVRSD